MTLDDQDAHAVSLSLVQETRSSAEGLFNTLRCEFNIGSVEEEDLTHWMHLFGTRVIPALRTFEPY